MARKAELEADNAKYAAAFRDGHRPGLPAKQLAVITCMDARINIAAALNLAIGDAHILLNAGGRVTDDTIRSLVISQRFLGVREVYVVHHTKCGLMRFDNEGIRAKVKADLGADAGAVDFLPFTDLEQSVRDDMKVIRDSLLMDPAVAVHGYIYNIDSGKIEALKT